MASKPTKRTVKLTAAFRKDYKRAKKRGFDTKLLHEVVSKLANDEALDAKHRDHPLEGNYKGHRECHVTPDWLLVYFKERDALILTLVETGTHSDLFGK